MDALTDKELIIRLQTQVEELEKKWCSVIADIKDIKDNLLRRPSWAVLAIITVLSTTSTALLVAFLNKH
jgi:hypothetical protein